MSKKVMVVDDSASVRQAVGTTLEAAGFSVVEAGDGREALSKLSGQRFDLIVSDVNMPNMDGITFVRQAKADPAHRFTPFLMLTTESSEDRKAEGKAAGAKAWLVKPFKPAVLLSAVNKLT